METIAIRVEKLSAGYAGRRVLKDISFELPIGRVVAVVGPNGSGKSTLFRTLVGLHHPDAGEAWLLGSPSRELSRDALSGLAYLSEAHGEWPRSTVSELSSFRASQYRRFDVQRFDELAAAFGLSRSMRFGEMSKGQKTGCLLSLAIAQNPKLLLLDEPTLGLDPLARRTVVEAILSLMKSGESSVAIASHEVSDIERIADELVLMSSNSFQHFSDLENFTGEQSSFEDGVLAWLKEQKTQTQMNG